MGIFDTINAFYAQFQQSLRKAPENVQELAEGISLEPLAYDSKTAVQPYLDEYEAYLRAQGVYLDWFSVDELTKLRRTGKHAIPPRNLWDEMARTILAVAQPLRSDFGEPLNIYNAFRPKWYNDLVGGAPRSLHIRNAALDLIPYRRASRQRFAELAAQFMIDKGATLRVGMGIYHYPRMTGVHVDALVRTKATPYSKTRRWMRRVEKMG